MKKGYLFCILAAMCFGIAPSALAFLLSSGVTEPSGVLLCCLFPLLTALPVCVFWRIPLRLPKGRAPQLLLVGAVGTGLTQLLLAKAYAYIPVGVATVIHFLYPTVVTVVSVVLFRQRGTLLTAAAIVCSIGGMLLISVVGGNAAGNARGFLFALASSLTYSFYLIGNERLRFGELPLPVVLSYLSAGASAALLACVLLGGEGITLPSGGTMWAAAVFVGLLSTGGIALLNLGISHVGAVKASFATLVEPMTSVICSAIVFHDKPTAFSILGFLLILCSVWLNTVKPHAHT